MQQVLPTDVPSEIVTWIVKKLLVSNTVDKMPRESPTQGNFYIRIFDKNGNNNLDASETLVLKTFKATYEAGCG